MTLLSKICKIYSSKSSTCYRQAAVFYGVKCTSLNRLLFASKQFSSMQRRYISFKGFRKATVEKFRAQDNIPNSFDLIYRSTVSSYLYVTQIMSSITAAALCVWAISTYIRTNQFKIQITEVKLKNVLKTEQQFFIFSTGFILLYISVTILISKCPVRIYFNSNTKQYLGVIYGKLPTTKNIIEYKIGEIVHTPSEGLLPWNEYKYKLKNGKILVMLDHNFRKPDDMNIMLGYTKL